MINCGVDIVETDRIEKAIESSGGAFRDRIFTLSEISYCDAKKAGMYQSFAARFAAKEAVSKAFGTGISSGMNFKDIEVTNTENGKPQIKLHGKAKEIYENMGGTELSISLSHCKSYAVAYCVLITNS